MRTFLIWIRKTWAKLFGKKPTYSSEDINFLISKKILKLAKENRVVIYNGTIGGLRNAQANPRSDVYIVEVLNPISKSALIKLQQYFSKLKKHVSVKKHGE